MWPGCSFTALAYGSPWRCHAVIPPMTVPGRTVPIAAAARLPGGPAAAGPGPVGLSVCSGTLHLLHGLHYQRRELLQLDAGADLDEFGARLRRRRVPGRQVERVAGLADLLMVGVADGHPPPDDITPVRARATAPGQPAEHRSQVMVLADGHEIDRVAIQVPGPVLGHAVVPDLGDAFLRHLRHLAHLLRLMTRWCHDARRGTATRS